MHYMSAVFLDFDNIYGCLYRVDASAARKFASEPGYWLDALTQMQGNEAEATEHNFIVRRCYMNPSGAISGDIGIFSRFRQNFVRDGWEMIDTPPLTSRGKTSADIHIVMDVMDMISNYPHVAEYVVMAADADYTPLIIRLRKHMKKTVVYSSRNTAVAYRAACDSIIDEAQFIELFAEEQVHKPIQAKGEVGRSLIVAAAATLQDVETVMQRYFDELGADHSCPLATMGHLLRRELGNGVRGEDGSWLGYRSLSDLVRAISKVELLRQDGDYIIRVRTSVEALS